MTKGSEGKMDILFDIMKSIMPKLPKNWNSPPSDGDEKDRINDKKKKTANPAPTILTKSMVLDYAEQLQNKFPDIAATRISKIENETTGEIHIIQSMCDSQGQTVFTASDHKEIVGREWPQGTKLSNEIIELIGDDVTCVISLSEQVLTFSQVLEYARETKIKFPQITQTQIAVIHNDKTGESHIAQNMLNEDGEYVYVDKNKEDIVGRILPVNTILCSQLKELMEGNVKCIIDI